MFKHCGPSIQLNMKLFITVFIFTAEIVLMISMSKSYKNPRMLQINLTMPQSNLLADYIGRYINFVYYYYYKQP